MRAHLRLALAALPGLAVVAAALAGWSPGWRDLPDYFVPLRERTSELLAGRRGPFWNPDVGCGEPYFANPQTGVLYPPAWLAALLPPGKAVWAEAGLHLALLAVGTALLARRLGARPGLEVAAGWGVLCAGPTLDAVGVLNNLDTLAWLPWLWWAALRSSWRLAGLFAAAAYLAAEPMLAVIGWLVALCLAPKRRTVAGLALALGLVAVQAIPFVAWVWGGDRGAGREAQEMTAGALLVEELPALLVPAAPLPSRPDRFVPHLTLPLWVILLGGIAVLAGPSRARAMALVGFLLLAASILPGLPGCGPAWMRFTGGLVRYPGRLVFPAVVALAAAAAAAVGRVRRPVWIGAAALLAVVGGAAVTGAPMGESVLQGVTCAVAVAGPAASVAAVAGSAALLAGSADILELRPMRLIDPWCLAAQTVSFARTYSAQPSRDQLVWVRGHPSRVVALGMGYVPLLDGRKMVRTFAPLQSKALEAHLAEADRGPAGRWWLDALGARRIVSQHVIPGFAEVCRAGEFVVYDNPQAWPETAMVRALPQPGEAPEPAGDVLASAVEDDLRQWRVRAAGGGAMLLWLETPDPGWRFSVDRRHVTVERGPGILQGVPIPAGIHEVRARYRPFGLLAGAAVSLFSLMVLLGALWRRS